MAMRPLEKVSRAEWVRAAGQLGIRLTFPLVDVIDGRDVW
jgi:hypothetical protein